MGNAADSLVQKNPTRKTQLAGPVLTYLSMVSRNLPFNGTEQDLYMSVFYPAYRRVHINTQFPEKVRKSNPGINSPADYIALVNKPRAAVSLSKDESAALKKTASELNISTDSLYKLINFESGWNPQAKNPKSGARGLIQFMPSTAAGMGYKGSAGVGMMITIMAIGYIIFKKFSRR